MMKQLKRRNYIKIITLCLTSLLFILVLPHTSAAPRVVLYSIDLSAEPNICDKDIPIIITSISGFGGACDYTVYAKNVTAELIIPSGLVLQGNNKTQPLTSRGETKPGWVTALPGGSLNKVKVNWTIIGKTYGIFTIQVRVSGYSIRQPDPDIYFEKNQSHTIAISRGIAILSPSFVKPLVTGNDNKINVSVYSNGIVEKVLMNYSFDNKTWNSISMTKLSASNYTWETIIPSQQYRKTLYFYFFATDSNHNKNTTGIYSTAIVGESEPSSSIPLEIIMVVIVIVIIVIGLIVYYRYKKFKAG